MNFDYNRLYMTTDGRIGRQDFWIGILGLFVVGIVVTVILSLLFGMMRFAGRLVGFLLQLVLAYPAYALFAKRFQDRDKPGIYAVILIGINIVVGLFSLIGITGSPTGMNWFGSLLSLVSLAVAIWFLVELGILRGTVGTNQYGPDPVG